MCDDYLRGGGGKWCLVMAEEKHRHLVARIVEALRHEGDGNEQAIACARVLEEAQLPGGVGEAAAQAVLALRNGPPVMMTEEAAVAAFTAHLLGRTGRRVVYTVGR